MAAAAAAAAVAARRVASGMGRIAPRSARCGYGGDTTRDAAAAGGTRTQLMPHAPSGALVILRRGVAMIPGDHSPGPTELSPDCFDPEAPDDPATCFAYDEKELESDETVWALYGGWCSFHSVERDHDDMVRRFGCFKDRAHRIIEFNKSGKSYTLGTHNIFGDRTPEEPSELERPQLLPRTC